MQKLFWFLVLIGVAAFVLHSKGMLGKKSEMLSRHETIAVFQGKNEYLCRGMTALCPNECGHSGKMAQFEIQEYLSYEKPGQYGDPKQDQFRILYVSDKGEMKVGAKYFRQIEYLRPGDTVYLSYQHNYITTKEGSKYPERKLTKLVKK